MIAPSMFSEHYVATRAGAFIAGGGLVRVLVYVSNQMPPLPSGSGWWTKFIYGIVKGTSGLDPSATITPPAK